MEIPTSVSYVAGLVFRKVAVLTCCTSVRSFDETVSDEQHQ